MSQITLSEVRAKCGSFQDYAPMSSNYSQTKLCWEKAKPLGIASPKIFWPSRTTSHALKGPDARPCPLSGSRGVPGPQLCGAGGSRERSQPCRSSPDPASGAAARTLLGHQPRNWHFALQLRRLPWLALVCFFLQEEKGRDLLQETTYNIPRQCMWKQVDTMSVNANYTGGS